MIRNIVERKNYLYKFKFVSGDYENYFYKQLKAENIIQALIEIYAQFMNIETDNAKKYLNDKLGDSWTENDFWAKIEMPIFSFDDMEAYRLDDVREIKYDLDRI